MNSEHHHEWAPVPPMGWNSWDAWGTSVSEDVVMGNARYMAENLKGFGWEYIVVDIQWYESGAVSHAYNAFAPLEMDEWSRLVPATNRFPSAKGGGGFAPLAERIHKLGLKFGIHIMRGVPRQAVHAATPIKGSPYSARDIAHSESKICTWNTDMYGVNPAHPGAQAWYDSLFELYASWGVDYVKVDDLADSALYGTHAEELRLIRTAIDACDRPMVLSLSPGPAPLDQGGFLTTQANLWRITNDFWDRWELLADMFDRCERWYPFVGAGHWPDCDMLPLGQLGCCYPAGHPERRLSRFTGDEQLCMMTLWSLFRSPLMMGGELTGLDAATKALLTHGGMLMVHREGRNPRPLFREGGRIAWQSDAPGGGRYLGLFNLGEEAVSMDIEALLARMGSLPAFEKGLRIRDLHEDKELFCGEAPMPPLQLPRHGARLLAVQPR
jgi:hypothetical protein